MTRKLIELHPGAIASVIRGQWHAAAEKLDEAHAGIKQMEAARNRISYENGWTRFVDSIEEFWARFFDEGKQRFSAFQPWAGALEKERRSDELLNYLIHSRHQSQHGRISLDWAEGKLHIAPGFSGHIQNLEVYEDGTYEMDATPLPGSAVEAKVTSEPGKAELPAIHDAKWKQSFEPPRSHNGARLGDANPISVARLALDYYTNLLQDAAAKFGRGE